MAENGWDAVVIGASDPHSSEYPAPRWQQVRWVSGFTGEAGDIVITRDHAGLWTDSRYFIQAMEQLQGTGIELHRTRCEDSVPIPQWLADRASVVAVDGGCMSISAVEDLRRALAEKHCEDIWKVLDVPDILDSLWTDRPRIPVSPVITLDETDVGESRLQKLVWLRKFLMANEYDAILLSSLDEIAWLLNVRGNDIEYNPYVISYLYVSLDRAVWFVTKGSKEPPAQDTVDSFIELKADGIEIAGYDDVFIGIADQDLQNVRLAVDRSSLNEHLYMYVSGVFGAENIIACTSPVALRKAVKNGVEIRSLREAYVEDGCAVEKFLYWLDTAVSSGERISEWQAALRLDEYRAEIAGYRGNSFATISAYAQNAALPHYSTPSEGSAVLEPYGLYLVDSGGQYYEGTTDITRTIAVGELTTEEKEHFTLTVISMLRLGAVQFLYGCSGVSLDYVAREPFWSRGLDYNHGTGHGVGFLANVHERPNGFRFRIVPERQDSCVLEEGMIMSDEPGIYIAGSHGVRTENLVVCKKAEKNEYGQFMKFEYLTFVPIDLDALELSVMTERDIVLLNDYHKEVYAKISPYLNEEEKAWLQHATREVKRG